MADITISIQIREFLLNDKVSKIGAIISDVSIPQIRKGSSGYTPLSRVGFGTGIA